MIRKTIPLILGVVSVHIAALWLLQTYRPPPTLALSVVPAQILIELVQPAAPKIVAAIPATVKRVVVKQNFTKAVALVPTNVPPPLAIGAEPLSVNTMRGSIASASVAAPAAPPSALTPPVAVAMASPIAPRVELPSSAAAYLQNPKPPYPALSQRLGEQGKVVLRVLIGVDGQAQEAEVDQSSGFDRLDRAALNTILKWRYVPGRRAGVAHAMWFNVPISFVLE